MQALLLKIAFKTFFECDPDEAELPTEEESSCSAVEDTTERSCHHHLDLAPQAVR